MTGVQTCALPISQRRTAEARLSAAQAQVKRQQLRLELMGPISAGVGGEYHFAIDNRDRTVGSWLAGLRLRHHPEATASSPWLTLYFDGSAGRGFGSWNVDGIHLVVTGDANDLVGRGMGGGQIVVRAHPGVAFDTTAACLLGQACLYGASGGTLFAAGRAGDHFAAANQGASAVVEGVGDHACEGMSAGTIVILGQTGINPGAGFIRIAMVESLETSREALSRLSEVLS